MIYLIVILLLILSLLFQLSDEEEQKRLIRRERNKMAAARCRKRRLDQTLTLQDETDGLENKRTELQNEIQLLQQQKDELEFLLKHHKRDCKRVVGHSKSSSVVVTSGSSINVPPTSFNNLTPRHSNIAGKSNVSKKVTMIKREQQLQPNLYPMGPSDVAVKEEHMSDSDEYNPPDLPTLNPQVTQASYSRTSLLIGANNPVPSSSATHYSKVVTVHSSNDSGKPNRPTTLNVGPLTDIGVSIETPSAGIRGLNFESMMEGGTGLTPVTPLAGSMVSLATGLTPLTTPIMAHPSASVTSCSSIVVTSHNSHCALQVSSASDLSSPDSIGSKHLVSL